MDIFTLSFYAAICGVLSLIAPGLGRAPNRLFFGMIVGVLAAVSLPTVRNILLG
ncbi:hypothetical protein RB2150_13296 [Rhodobacteraceae bacterium HTCC2150]|nr:hypothetical protein RB2150_13296 [Rhodobacteraceae bacterium HTCC2150]